MRNLKKTWLLAAALSLFPVTTVLAAADAAPPKPAAVSTHAVAPAPSTALVAPTAAPEAPMVEKAAGPVKEVRAWWKGILVTVIEVAIAVLLPILSVLFMSLAKKWGLKLEQDKIDWILGKALGFAEQKAKVALKDGKPMEGPELAKLAVEHGTKLLNQYQLAGKFGVWLADGIEAKLGEGLLEEGGRNVNGKN